MYDFHVHSDFSDDSTSPMESMVAEAEKKSLTGICFTDHLDIDYPSTEIAFNFKYEKYFKEFHRLKEIYQKKVEIYSGIEVGVQPHILSDLDEFMADKSFDYVIASIHAINKKELYGQHFLDNLTDQQAIDKYFEEMLFCIEHYSNFDVFGHLDVIRRYINGTDQSFSFEKSKDSITHILKKLIHGGKGIEINTSGIRYNLTTFHPLPDILKLYKELGGEIIAVGSDAHKPADLAYGLPAAFEFLREIGFSYYTVFKNRKAQFIKL